MVKGLACMKKSTALCCGVLLVIAASCNKGANPAAPADPHVANANCAGCHATEQSQWAQAADLHALSPVACLTDATHNTSELLVDNCLKCHSTFQYALGVAHFVTPVNQVGSPAGTWTALNVADWQATKCEVCHDPSATNTAKLAKYGSILDGPWSAGYTSVSALPAAYQKVIDIATGDTSTYIYPDQTTLAVQATKLCNTCHDPADQGGDSAITQGGINYGPQGGDSRAYVGANHEGFGCIDCHAPHNFMPVNPDTTTACKSCHSVARTGKVHFNHL
jgi:hypothetical protein